MRPSIPVLLAALAACACPAAAWASDAASDAGAATRPHPAHEHERVFEHASELVGWCREEAEAHYVAAGATPYQWTARHYSRDDVLYVEATLRVDRADVGVTCRVARGARERHATLELADAAR